MFEIESIHDNSFIASDSMEYELPLQSSLAYPVDEENELNAMKCKPVRQIGRAHV